jgi:P4 family phage/plasmid primase-like protien
MSNHQCKRKFVEFLNVMKSVKDSTFTHTSITEPTGSFYLRHDDMDTFYDLYKTSMKNGCNLFLTEKHRDISPVLIDFDLRFDKDVIERQYSIDMIKNVIHTYIDEISKYVDVPANIAVYLMEKQKPLFIEKKNLVKDGVHIMITNIVTRPSVQLIVRENILKKLDDQMKGMKYTNSIADVFDEQVIYKNNWQMYGSQKPNSEPYKVTHHWSYDFDTKEFDEVPLLENDCDYVEVLSIRNKYKGSNVKQKFKETLTKLDKTLVDDESKKEKKKRIYNKIIQNHESNFKPTCEEISLVKKLINILDEKRAKDYCDWIRLGWCLRNIDVDLLAEWDTFSKKCIKYQAGECDLLWYKMKEGGLGIGTLHMWAKQDNFEEYKKLITDDISSLIYKSLSMTDYDIALVIARMFKHRFRCASHKHHVWYEFEGHGWKEKEKGYTLFYKEIPTVLFNEYMKAIEKESARARMGDDREKDICAKNIESLTKISLKLKSTNFVKDKMYKECSGLFYEPKFEEKLDANPTLLGFENGVYDLDNDEFREGRPEDYVSLSTGINYIEYDVDNPYLEDIDEFMRKVLVNDNVRDYVFTLFASILDGTNRDEKFHIWTGSGCHAFNTKIMMFDGTYKFVQDIAIGDKLMGDDSTERNVLELFRGKDEMYKITPKRGKTDSFVVNKEHVLSLKMTNVTSSYYHKDSDTWCVNWMERHDTHIIVNKSKSFKENFEAIQFMDELSKDKKVLQKHDKVDMKMCEYETLKHRIGSTNMYLYRPDFIEFNEQPVMLDPYMMGYWLGDGYSQESLFITTDYEVLDYFEEKLPEIDCKMVECKSDLSDKENAKVMSISATKKTMNNNNFTKALIKYDLENNKHVPEEYKINSREVRLQLLAGLLDSDGYYQYDKETNVNQYEITLKNEKILDGIVFIARSLGLAAYKSKKTRCNNGVVGEYYRCMIYGEGISEIPCIIERKKAIETQRHINNKLVGFTTESVGQDAYYGFELDGNHRYVMEHEFVTHNSNGKSKIVELFQHTIGEYACIFNVSLLTQKRVGSNATNSELAIAKGKRFGILQEPEENERLNVGLMKELTGGDQIQCRCLFKEPIKFKPMFKMILTCNHMPSIPPDDGGTWRRIRRVEYTSKFTDNPDPNNEYEFQIDRELGYKFEMWKETFMVMLLRYYKIYKKKGKIVEPQEVLEYTREYQRKNDIFADFCESYITKDPGSMIDVTTLFDKFKEFCNSDNIKNRAKKTSFQEAMEKRYGKLTTVKGTKCWKGIKLIPRIVSRDDEDDEIDED